MPQELITIQEVARRLSRGRRALYRRKAAEQDPIGILKGLGLVEVSPTADPSARRTVRRFLSSSLDTAIATAAEKGLPLP